MRIIARIPDVSVPVETAAAPPDLVRRPAPRPGERRRHGARSDGAWTSWPVAALAVIAVVTWMLASWNDMERLRRQRDALRLAREPAPHGTTQRDAAAGAMVR